MPISRLRPLTRPFVALVEVWSWPTMKTWLRRLIQLSSLVFKEDRWRMSLQPKLSLLKKRWILPLKSMQLTWLRTVRPWLMSSCKILISVSFQAEQRTTFSLSMWRKSLKMGKWRKTYWTRSTLPSTRTLFLMKPCLHLRPVGFGLVQLPSPLVVLVKKKVAPLLNSWSKRWRMRTIKKY